MSSLGGEDVHGEQHCLFELKSVHVYSFETYRDVVLLSSGDPPVCGQAQQEALWRKD
jgi:siroheme synthase